ELFQVKVKDALDAKLWDALPLSDFTRTLSSLVNESDPVAKEQMVVFPGDRLFVAQFIPVYSEGRNTGVVCILKDMAGMQKIERSIEQFVTDVTRQLKVPLTTIKGFVETLLEGAYQSPEITRRFMQVINEETNRLTRLVLSLEGAAAPDQGLRLSLRPTPVSSLLEGCYQLFAPMAEQKNLTLALELPEHLPLVEIDPEQMRRVLDNLVDNALKFTGLLGQGCVRVTAEASSNGQVVVSVADTGVGIEPTEQSKIFEAFYRVESGPASELGGTGLGLSVARQVVEAHGGRIGVESRPGQGARFWFTLKALG
ncbi:MAG: HAMP domain-containing sensor histidine kinase, partial [Candidatus Eremiobacterota bacterium]